MFPERLNRGHLRNYFFTLGTKSHLVLYNTYALPPFQLYLDASWTNFEGWTHGCEPYPPFVNPIFFAAFTGCGTTTSAPIGVSGPTERVPDCRYSKPAMTPWGFTRAWGWLLVWNLPLIQQRARPWVHCPIHLGLLQLQKPMWKWSGMRKMQTLFVLLWILSLDAH